MTRRVLIGLAIISAMTWPQAPVTLYLIGDSTMADKPDPEHNPERGWGQSLPAFVSNGAVVRNHAVNGRSTKSFIDEGRWEAVRAQLKAGDYVFIEFGHNDEKVEDTTRYAAAAGAYRRNLERFVAESRAAGAIPVLFTPIVRRQFTAVGAAKNSHGDYPEAVREVAKATQVELIDLERLSARWLERAGPDSSKLRFVFTRQGEYPAFPLAREDNTHLSPRGAAEVARLAATALRERIPALQPLLHVTP